MRGTAASRRPEIGRAGRVLGELAPSVVVGMALLVVGAELAHWVDVPFLSSVTESRVILTALTAFLVAAIVKGARVAHRSKGPALGGERPAPLLAAYAPAIPAGVLSVYAVMSRLLLPEPRRLEWFLGGDNLRHVVMTAAERSDGFLDYAVQPYPRAWHTLMAAVWSATGAHDDAHGLLSLIDVMSTGVWLLYALLSLSTGLLAQTLATRLGLRASAAGLAGLLAATLTLVPTLVSNYLVLGFHNSVLGALLLAVASREVVLRPATLRAVVVTASCALVMAHAWQLLLPGVLVAFTVVSAAQVWPALRRRLEPLAAAQSLARGAIWVVVTVLLALGAAVPSAVAVTTKVGIGHATDAGVYAPVPWTLLSLATLSSLVVLGKYRRDLPVVAVILAVVGTGISGLLLAARVGVSPTTYYPSKLLWHSAVLGLAPTSVVGVHLLGRLKARAQGVRRVVWLLVCTALGWVMVLSLANPLMGASGYWPSPDGTVVLRAVTTRDAARAQVVWTGDGGDDTVSRVLLDFYRVQQTAIRTPQDGLDVAAECELLDASADAAVLSTMPEATVRARYACAPGLVSIPLRPDLP